MINAIAIAIGLLFIFPASSVSQGSEHSEKDANELARSILQNEVKAEANDQSQTLKSVGIQCALCHSTVDNSIPALCAGQITPNPGTGCIGHRLDGWANRDLNVGAIVALAPDLSVIANLLSTDQATVRKVLNSWGPGKFDAELLLDGKAFNPQQVTDGVVTGTNVSGASLIPPAFGLGGVNLHLDRVGFGSALERVRCREIIAVLSQTASQRAHGLKIASRRSSQS